MRVEPRGEGLEAAAREPIAIIGLGCRVPGGGNDADSFWRLMRDGVDAIGPLPADLQAIKACGVTFARSMIERVIEERAGGNPARAAEIRARAAEALRALPDAAWATPPLALTQMAAVLGRAMGGSSGPFYATALMRAARGLSDQPTPRDWANAFAAAVASITELGGAVKGNRGLLRVRA